MTEANGAGAPAIDELKRLLRKADKGDRSVLPALRAITDTLPGFWTAVGGDLAQLAREALIKAATGGKNLLAHEAIEQKLSALTQELAGPAPAPLERLLIERITVC